MQFPSEVADECGPFQQGVSGTGPTRTGSTPLGSTPPLIKAAANAIVQHVIPPEGVWLQLYLLISFDLVFSLSLLPFVSPFFVNSSFNVP